MSREIPVDIESLDLDETFEKIDKLQERLKNECGINWHTYSYFVLGNFWRFDWEYIWNENDEDLEALLNRAIEFGEKWLE